MTQAQFLWIHFLSLCVSIAAGIYGYVKVQSPTIAIHFKLDGSPDRYAPVVAGMFGLPLGGVIFLLFSIWSAGHLTAGPQTATNVIPTIVQVILAAAQVYIVFRALRA